MNSKTDSSVFWLRDKVNNHASKESGLDSTHVRCTQQHPLCAVTRKTKQMVWRHGCRLYMSTAATKSNMTYRKRPMHGAPSKPTVQLPLAHQAIHDWQVVKQDNWTGKQGPLQKHSQLNHTTVRSCKKKKMSRKLTSPLN